MPDRELAPAPLIHASRPLPPRSILLGLVVACSILLTACGGVINPPVPTATPVPTVRAPSTQIPPTATPAPVQWVKNHRITEMWGGPASDRTAASLGRTSHVFCSFRIERSADDARIFVYNPYEDNRFWIDADAVGPVEPPERRPGPKPSGRNCAEIVYDDVATTPGSTRTMSPSTPPPSSTPQPRAADPAMGQPLVVALYYAWYGHGTWETGQTADLPAEPYGSSEPAAIKRHVDWAREAGIDALICAWFGIKDNNPTETNFVKLLAEAERSGLRAGLLLETDNNDFFPSREALIESLRHFLDVHAQHPAYFRVDGRPVILIWRPESVYATNGVRVNVKSETAVDAWDALIAEVDPNRQAIWIAEGDFFGMLRVFDGIFPYSIAWSRTPADQLVSYGHSVRSRAAALGADKIWVPTAMPGYDDTRIEGRPNTFAVGRDDGAYYETTFQGAIDSGATWVNITSFNEWLEGTQIEPSQQYGRQYIEQTRSLTERFKGTPTPPDP